MKKNNDVLFIGESEINAKEYSKMSLYFPNLYTTLILLGTIINVFICLILYLISKNYKIPITVFVSFEMTLLVFYEYDLENSSLKYYNTLKKRNKVKDLKYTICYKEDSLIVQYDNSSTNVLYNEINRVVETKDDIYLYRKKKKLLINIKKENCDKKLLCFLDEKFKDREIYLSNNPCFKTKNIFRNNKFVKTILIILFILTICSLIFAIKFHDYLDITNNSNSIESKENIWGLWCFLPIPVISIVLGHRFQKRGYNCYKNIIVGFIICGFLYLFGLFWIFPVDSDFYNKINNNINKNELNENITELSSNEK